MERRERASSGNGKKNWKRDGGRPSNGRQLFGYVKDWRAEGWFKDWGRDHNCPSMFSEWNDNEVADAVYDFEAERDSVSADHNGAAY
jgi:hypothetical protein